MLFYTPLYLLIFLPLTLLLFNYSKKIKLDKKILIIILSIIFYSWWNIYYLPLIIFSIILNFYFSKILINKFTLNKRLTLFFGIFFNVLILIIFKYLDFIILNLNNIFHLNIGTLDLPFPLALSFVTFQLIAFLINCYDNEIHEINIKNFFLFVLFFPQLIAGPIVRYNYMIPQFEKFKDYNFKFSNFSFGLIIILIGLIKKVIFANTLGIYVDDSYSNIQNLDFITSWLLSLSFTFQLYFDFSGYIDMATGSAILFNIFLPINFNSPFKACSVIDFWKRWHITLSQFLTNFIYTPWIKSLKKITFFKSMLIIIVVFLIAGIWHGPTWCFVLFGFFHGLGLVINHLYNKYFSYKLNNILSWFLTFNFINISFIFFRSENIFQVKSILSNMFLINHGYIETNINELINKEYIAVFTLSLIVCFVFKNTTYLINKHKNKF